MKKVLIMTLCLAVGACSEHQSPSKNLVTNEDLSDVLDRITALETSLTTIRESLSEITADNDQKVSEITETLKTLGESSRQQASAQYHNKQQIATFQSELGNVKDKIIVLEHGLKEKVAVVRKKAVEEKRKNPSFPFIIRTINQVGNDYYLAISRPGVRQIQMFKVGDTIGSGWTMTDLDLSHGIAKFSHRYGKIVDRKVRS